MSIYSRVAVLFATILFNQGLFSSLLKHVFVLFGCMEEVFLITEGSYFHGILHQHLFSASIWCAVAAAEGMIQKAELTPKLVVNIVDVPKLRSLSLQILRPRRHLANAWL